MANEKKYRLTKDIKCEWCQAEPGEPCKLQLTWEEQQKRRENYKLGTESLQGEKIHYIRSVEIEATPPQSEEKKDQ